MGGGGDRTRERREERKAGWAMAEADGREGRRRLGNGEDGERFGGKGEGRSATSRFGPCVDARFRVKDLSTVFSPRKTLVLGRPTR